MTTNTEATPEIKSDRKLSQALLVSTRTIVEWKKIPGSPKKSADGIWNLSEWKKFMDKQGLGNRSKAARNPELEKLKNEKTAAQIRIIELQTERLRIRNSVSCGEAIPLDQAREQFQMCWKPMIQHLRGTKHRLGQAVVGLPSSGAAKVIAKDLQETSDLFCVPEHLKRDPFWREMDKEIQKIKKKSGKI